MSPPGGRVDRYPLLPAIYQAIYPNPPLFTAYDTTLSSPVTPGRAEISASTVASCQGKMENSDDPFAFSTALTDFKRCVMLSKKGGFKAWQLFRDMYGAPGTDFGTLDVKDPKMDRLVYEAAPSTQQKWGF